MHSGNGLDPALLPPSSTRSPRFRPGSEVGVIRDRPEMQAYTGDGARGSAYTEPTACASPPKEPLPPGYQHPLRVVLPRQPLQKYGDERLVLAAYQTRGMERRQWRSRAVPRSILRAARLRPSSRDLEHIYRAAWRLKALHVPILISLSVHDVAPAFHGRGRRRYRIATRSLRRVP